MILAELGAAFLFAALGLSGVAAGAAFTAGFRRHSGMATLGRRSFYASAYLVMMASLTLELAIVRHDFVIAFVAEHTSRSTPAPLLAAGFYGGNEGSLLYWALVLAALGSLAVHRATREDWRLATFAAGVLSTLLAFLLLLLTFVTPPFAVLSSTPADGLGLNPLLRDEGMLVHPPFLLAGFSSFAIPFSFAMASLLAGRLDARWVRLTHGFALLAWGLQGSGLLLGMWWAYHVLGWGGYWGWDPVENVALLPWLATTAYLHSAQVQERRGKLAIWNLGLVTVAFGLSIFGTFVVRSGVIQSVHAFAVAGLGPWFFGFLILTVLAAGGAIALRGPVLRVGGPVNSLLSREAAFVFNNLLFLGLAGAVLWGTLLPLFSGLVGGEQQVVGASFYERTTGPIFLVLLALMALAPLLPWSGASRTWVRRLPWVATGAAATLAALLGAGVRNAAPLLSLPLIAAVAATCGLEFAKGGQVAARVRQPWALAALRLGLRQRRRYGAYLAHLGIAVIAAGIAGSHFWQQERQLLVRPGQNVRVGSYALSYQGVESRQLPDATELTARIRLDGDTLTPRRLIYPRLQQSATSVAIRSTPIEDLYIVLSGVSADGSAALLVFVNPMVPWIWVGGALLIIGTLAGNLGVVARKQTSAQVEDAALQPAQAPLPAGVATAAVPPGQPRSGIGHP